MHEFGIWYWVIAAAFTALILVPIVKIVGRTGRSRWWAILVLIPYVNLIALWVFAFTRWPALDHAPSKDSD